MPLSGTLDVATRLDRAARMPDTSTAPLEAQDVEVLQVMYEMPSPLMEPLIPAALHPTIPATVTFLFYRVPDSEIGAFTLAQTRVGCRAGVRPRGMPVGCFIDNAEAGAALEARWGYRCSVGDVKLRRYHHKVVGSVDDILEVELVDPEAISGTDVQYTANMNLAVVGDRTLLVQCDPEYVFQKADRGRPNLLSFDAAAWGEERIQPVYAVSAHSAVCTVTLPKIRYVCDPNVSAMQGTEKVG